jgi:hypothetical protein
MGQQKSNKILNTEKSFFLTHKFKKWQFYIYVFIETRLFAAYYP